MSNIQQLWNEINIELEKYVCSKVNHEDQCNDILHDVYLKLVANVERLNRVENVKGYLVRIASNTIADHYRATRSTVASGEIEISENPASTCACSPAGLSEAFIKESIGQLPEKYKEAITRIDLEGMSQKEYADAAGISLSGAKSRVQRAREQLKEIILKCCSYQFDRYGNIIKCCGEDID